MMIDPLQLWRDHCVLWCRDSRSMIEGLGDNSNLNHLRSESDARAKVA
jgi:hypothetical protein